MYDTLQEENISLAIKIFKGLDLKSPEEQGAIDICQNWRFDRNGNLSRRPTYSKYNSASLGANPITYLERIYIGTNKYLLAVYSTNLKVGSDSAGTFSNLATVTADQRYTGVTYKNFHYLGNGVDANIKTDGTLANTSAMGCPPPVTVPSCFMISGAQHLDLATYGYKFTREYDGYQESNAAMFVSAATSATKLNIALQTFGASAINQTHLRIYRTEGGGSTYYYHSRHTVGTLSAYLTAAPYIDDTADSSLDTTTTSPTDNGIPLSNKFFLLHNDRIFLAGNSTYKSYLYFSKISGIVSYPDIFPANNYIPISENDGDEIMGLAHDPQGYLCIFKRNSIRKIFTDGDPASWEVSEPFTIHGCWASSTIKETSIGIIYLAKDGWRIFNGQTSTFISNSDRINKIIRDEISLTRFGNCVGHFNDNLCYLSYTDRDSGVGHNNRLLIYDTLSDNFIIDTKNIASFATLGGLGDWGQMYYGDSVNGYVYNEEINIAGIIYSKLSDFRPNGTLSNLVAWNTEADPYLELGGHYTFDRMNGSAWNDFGSATTISAFDMFPTNYTPSGVYTSPVIQVKAKSLYYAYWNEILGGYGDVTIAFRTSNTSAGLSGTYSSEYTNPAGSDISGLTGEDWLQFRLTLSSTNLSATPRVYTQNGYAVKITYNVLNEKVEESIDCDWRSGYTQITPENVICRARRFEVEHEGTAGLLSCIWDLDKENMSGIFCVDLENNPKSYIKPFPTTAFGKKIRMRLHYDNINDLVIKAINILASPQPERY
jgi:hypothetical protein